MATHARLGDPWMLGGLRVPNRVLLAPLAGIGNWFVRLQAKRYGAGLAVSEMVSSHAVHHGNVKTCLEMLRIDERERAGGPVAIQLFGAEPEIMRSAAAQVAERGADAIDINMGCPVAKVRKTGAGVQLLGDPERAVAVAAAAVQGALAPDGRRLPVTVKLRCGLRRGERDGLALAHRLVAEARVAAIAIHPRSAEVQHKGVPEYELARELARSLPAPVILTGGLSSAARVREAFAYTGVAAVMLARGALGNPWLFAELLQGRSRLPQKAEVLDELTWTMQRAVEHLGEARATRYLRKFYPWYVQRLALSPSDSKALQAALAQAGSLAHVRRLLSAQYRAAEPASQPSAVAA